MMLTTMPPWSASEQLSQRSALSHVRGLGRRTLSSRSGRLPNGVLSAIAENAKSPWLSLDHALHKDLGWPGVEPCPDLASDLPRQTDLTAQRKAAGQVGDENQGHQQQRRTPCLLLQFRVRGQGVVKHDQR